MRLSVTGAVSVLFVSLLALSGCEPSDDGAVSTVPAAPVLSAKSSACSLGRMSQDARGYFPGKGKGSIAANVQDLVTAMQGACTAGNAAAYTAHWFDVAGILEGVLEAGTGGDPALGASFLAASVGVLGPDEVTPIFRPCGGAAGCIPWEGYPALPDFFGALSSADGTWAVVSTGTEAVCSSFIHPCANRTSSQGDAWGIEPSDTWQAALANRKTVVFGRPIPGPSPTGELLVDADLPAYQLLLIPEPAEFGVGAAGPAELNVGLCSAAATTLDELLIQKGNTILTEASIASWCTIDGGLASSRSFAHRLAGFLAPTPAPLHATMAGKGPGGSAGGFTDFYGVDTRTPAVLVLPGQPADGFVGQQLMAQNGQPLVVRTSTSTAGSPLENAHVTMTVIGNGGLIPSGEGVSGTGLTCEDFVCTGFTQADEDPVPGSLFLPLVITKTGSYTLCFTASLPPLQFADEVCSVKFNIRP